MIVKVKKRDLLILTGALILIILLPLIYSQTQTVKTGSFTAWLVISNQGPRINATYNVTGITIIPSTGSTKQVLISFNASDPDGVTQLNGTDGGRVIINLTLGPPSVSQSRSDATCTNTSYVNHVTFTCTIDMQYYDNASSAWVINITVIDSNSGTFTNDTGRFTYDDLAGFTLRRRGLSESGLNFTSLNIGDDDKPAKTPILLNNTGNNDFDQINITAADLISGGSNIGVGNFTINITNGTAGNGMRLYKGAQVIPDSPGISSDANATLLHGPGMSGQSVTYAGVTDFKSKGNLSLYFWVDVPTGIGTGTYNATWNLTLVDID